MEEEGIKILDLIKSSKPFTRDLPGCSWIPVVIVGDTEARERDFTDRIFRLNQILQYSLKFLASGYLPDIPTIAMASERAFDPRVVLSRLPCSALLALAFLAWRGSSHARCASGALACVCGSTGCPG